MTPEQLARDAVRLVDQLERAQLRRIIEHLQRVEQDAITLLDGIDLTDTSTSRVIKELHVRQVLAQSRAAQELLALGNNTGPIAEEFRRGIQAVYEDGVRTAVAAAVDAGVITAAQAAAFAPRVELEFIRAVTETTLTTLARVSSDGLVALEQAIVRGAVRGIGPRATARLVRENLDLTRYEAERITRTVFMRAANEARDQMWDGLNIEYLRFDATNDDRTCEFCASRHGEIYVRDRAPRPPLHPHCRCVLLPFNPNRPDRAAEYYARTRAEMADARGTTTPLAAAPFERMDGIPAPRPVNFSGGAA